MDDCEVVSRELSDDRWMRKILSKDQLYSGGQFTGTWTTAEEGAEILREVSEKRWRSALIG